MQILNQEFELEVQLHGHQQGLHGTMHQRSSEFRCRFTPMESDPSKEFPFEVTSKDVRSMPASRRASIASRRGDYAEG